MTDAGAPRPYALVAELTHRCPLSCAYCSNPLVLAGAEVELGTADWARVFAEAAALGVLQVNLTGGEPLVRPDLEALVSAARAHDLYINLITSGIPADADRLARLAAAGLDSLQLSIQDLDPHGAAWIAGRDDLDAKLATAEGARALKLPLTLNVVLHRGNIGRVPAFVALAERLGAPLSGRDARRDRAALPPGAVDPHAVLGERARSVAGRHLDRRGRLSRLPR